jgi:predicted oxidoreductase
VKCARHTSFALYQDPCIFVTMSQSEVPKDLPEMEYRFVGRSGLQISAISLGGWLTYGGHVGDDNTFACLKAAYDAGINFFDCAEGYAQGESEKVMGRAIKHFGWTRSDIVVSTKVDIVSNIRIHHANIAHRSTGVRTTPPSPAHATR